MEKTPKIIHYCWFGGNNKGDFLEQCINSWRDKLKEYEIIQWDESNIDVRENSFTYNCYINKQWAFLSDYIRLKALYEYGGIYLDTDVEIRKSLDKFMNGNLILGFQNNSELATAFIICTRKNKYIGELIDFYNKLDITKKELKDIVNNKVFTEFFKKRVGLIANNTNQIFDNIEVYTDNYFSLTNKEAYAVHYYNNSWLDKDSLIKQNNIYKTNYFYLTELIEYIINNETKALVKNLKGKKVAIYGIGNIGKILLEIFERESLDIKCILDKGYIESNYKGYEVIREILDIKYEEIDIIIVSNIYYFSEIKTDLLKYTKAEIIRADSIIKESNL